MKASIVQYNPEYLNTQANLDRIESLLEDCEADLIVLPELFASGYFFKSSEDVEEVAEEVPGGQTTMRIQGWARRWRATFVAGLPERMETGFYNSAIVVTPSGLAGIYRKTHLYYEEKLYFKPGDTGFKVFEVPDRAGNRYRLGVMICFDWYFPESARSLALMGADVIAHPSNLVRPNCPSSMPVRALENHIYTLTANRIGEETNGTERLTFIGQSVICSPEGEVLFKAGRDETVVGTAEIDPTMAGNRQITRHNDLLEDRRPALYHL